MINVQKITDTLSQQKTEDPSKIQDILAKARKAKGLDFEEVAQLTTITDPELINELFKTAKQVKEEIYGNRIVLFAPLYISNLCTNECLYCAFRATNKAIKRRSLTQDEIAHETHHLINQGHKRILLVAGESNSRDSLPYILDSIATVYDTKNDHNEIRRINVNIAPLSLDEFRQLKDSHIGTYQLFQETYHPEIYSKVHAGGKKADYNWRLSAIDRSIESGIDDVGIGVLFGLADWHFELLALIEHVNHLKAKFGIGPHTISVPRLEHATGSELASHPPFPVSDADFCKIIAILRLAVPSAGLILSTRENPTLRRHALALGVSQISAGSKTNPGGYEQDEADNGQFFLGDHRSLDEVVSDLSSLDYIPSFCTACYRLGRTGEDFMHFATSGAIKNMCTPNALATFVEYLEDFAKPETKKIGQQLIQKELDKLNPTQRTLVNNMIDKVRKGQRDVYL